MSDMDFPLTPGGYEEIQRELSEIITVKRPEVIQRIRDARQMGDVNDNSDYEDAKHLQAMLDARVKELRAILSHASVVSRRSRNGLIGIGSRVTVEDLDDGSQDEFLIVGPAESSPGEGKISHESCVGEALLNHKAGDVVTVETPGGRIRYKIVSAK